MDYTAYPPSIEGVIPAFTGYIIKIPFTHNPAVTLQQVVGYSLKLRYINNELIKNDAGESTINDGVYDAATNSVIFNLQRDAVNNNNLDPYKNSFISYDINIGGITNTKVKSINIGDYFKVQLAYIFKDTSSNNSYIGAYSTIGVTKHCAIPTINITGLVSSELNRLTKNQRFEGNYITNTLDPDERLYSYQMSLYDNNLNLLDTSGEKLFYALDAETAIQSVSHIFYTAIKKNKIYKVQFSGTTVNGLKVQSPMYQLMEITTKTWPLNGYFWAELNKDNAYISLRFLEDLKNDTYLSPGKYMILRENSGDNYSTLLPIGTVKIDTGQIRETSEIFKDFCIEQGVIYKYYIQQYNNYNIYSESIYARSPIPGEDWPEDPDFYTQKQKDWLEEKEATEIKADFEDMFLYDGKVQLKISFNPTVSSFKTTLLEQKSDTIGGKYPFFYSNGQVGYKEISIGGLISYHMDEQELFCSKDELWLDNTSEARSTTSSVNLKINNIPTINQVDYNFTAERKFKLKVLDWLNNKEYKLFKSPTEGNYIVRLMNVSLSPEAQLSRMLHTFSATAYECAELTYENLILYNFHNIIDQTIWTDWPVTIQIKDLQPDINGWYTITKTNSVTKELICQDLHAGDKLELTFADGTISTIIIGPTGAYQIRNAKVEINKIRIQKYVSTSTLGTISYVARIPLKTEFENIEDIVYETMLAKPFYKIETHEEAIKSNDEITDFGLIQKDEDGNDIPEQYRYLWEFDNSFEAKALYELELFVEGICNITELYFELYNGINQQIKVKSCEYDNDKNITKITTQVFNIDTKFNCIMVYYNSSNKPLSWKLYKDREQNLTKAIINYNEKTDIISLYLVQFFVPEPINNTDNAWIKLTYQNGSDVKIINIDNNRWYNLRLNYTIEENNTLPIISMSNNVIACVTGLTQTEVYTNA